MFSELNKIEEEEDGAATELMTRQKEFILHTDADSSGGLTLTNHLVTAGRDILDRSVSQPSARVQSNNVFNCDIQLITILKCCVFLMTVFRGEAEKQSRDLTSLSKKH